MKNNYSFKINQKIMGGFLLLIVIFILNAGLVLISLNRSDSIIKESSQITDPSLACLNDFNLMATNSRMFITNWVYLRANTEDKEALKKQQQIDYPKLKNKIKDLMPAWSKTQQDKIDSVFTNFDQLLVIEKEIMAEMSSFDAYEDEATKFMNQARIDDEVLPKSRQIMKQLQEIIVKQKEEKKRADATVLSAFGSLRKVFLVSGILIIAVGLITALLLTKSITTPINYIRDIIRLLGLGELPQEQKMKFNNDEIGEMAVAVNKLVAGLRSTSSFAESIGSGNYKAEFTPLSEKDVLGNALLNMRNNLEKVAEDDKKRNWATEGVAKFSEILRKNNDSIAKLSDDIISNLIKYTKSNQGGLFIINNDDTSEPFLELRACYAWDKKKYLEQKIYLGEGLAGQTWQEGATTYITEVPDNYIHITSGLGEANPRSILIVPLKINDEIFGIVEMASFYEFQPHEIEFVEKIAESIASTISSAKINERTQKLLEESTMLTEQMRAQEEEMRQNMEELQATQEEMQRAQRDAKAREHIFDATQLIVEFDSRHKIIYANQVVQSKLMFDSKDLVGLPIETIFESSYVFDKAKEMLAQGEVWSERLYVKNKLGNKYPVKASIGTVSNTYQGGERYLLILDGMEEQHD